MGAAYYLTYSATYNVCDGVIACSNASRRWHLLACLWWHVLTYIHAYWFGHGHAYHYAQEEFRTQFLSRLFSRECSFFFACFATILPVTMTTMTSHECCDENEKTAHNTQYKDSEMHRRGRIYMNNVAGSMV